VNRDVYHRPFFWPRIVDQLLQSAHTLDGVAPRKLIEWTLENFPNRAMLTVSFGGGGLVLAHMLSEVDKSVPVIFLNTGFLFTETLELRDRLIERYRMNVLEFHPATDPGPLYETDTDQCCHIRKVEPMRRALHGYDAWMSALRRDQSSTRQGLRVAEIHDADGRDVLKVHPLLHWDRKQVWHYLYDNKVPTHPLLDRGYSSIGCWPCTRPTAPGDDERAGRWAGSGKTECGLHTFTTRTTPSTP
jgi:phosphoadenosine phosphosulfate reductase